MGPWWIGHIGTARDNGYDIISKTVQLSVIILTVTDYGKEKGSPEEG